jgi:hypothetical protein
MEPVTKSPAPAIPGEKKNQCPNPGPGLEHIGSISTLINAAYYFLQNVFILLKKDTCRLVVLNNNRLLHDRDYRTMKGARIAFQKKFGHKAWKDGIKNDWSPPYPPDTRWLRKKIHRP